MDPDSKGQNRRLSYSIEKAVEILHKFIIPVYGSDRRKKPEQIGTGFIVRSGPHNVFVSAAHVIAQTPDRELFFYIEPQRIRKITGKRILGRLLAGVDDKLDIGGVLLSDEHLPPYSAVEKFAVDVSYLRPTYLPRTGKEYVVVGFPASRSKRNPKDRSVRVNPYPHHSPSASADIYQACGLSPDSHVILPFDLKRGVDAAGQRIILPKPQGMSGAPIWVLYEANDDENRVFPLVAVGTRYQRQHNAMIATDCRVVLDMINALG